MVRNYSLGLLGNFYLVEYLKNQNLNEYNYPYL